MQNPDPEYLKNDQYKDASRLAARARLHADYSSNPQGWFDWMFELYHFSPDAKLLELGAGAGWLWLRNRQRIPASWDITLSDFSAGMVAEQKERLARIPHPFKFEVIDIQNIPYPDDTFDGVIANNMLYHVSDRPKAIAEMRRVLKTGGMLYTATNGETHLQEIRHIIGQFVARYGLQPGEWQGGMVSVQGYTLENAAEQLRAQFEHVELHRYIDDIKLTDAEPLVAYILSARVTMSDERIELLRAFVQEQLDKHNGTLPLTKDMGVLSAY
jgi:ubiquinone/menaquinone biosynthesis C-methylase UbiE